MPQPTLLQGRQAVAHRLPSTAVLLPVSFRRNILNLDNGTGVPVAHPPKRRPCPSTGRRTALINMGIVMGTVLYTVTGRTNTARTGLIFEGIRDGYRTGLYGP